MITLSTSGNSVIFTFQDNQHYLQNGTIEVPKNSLLLVTDDSNMATFKKSASNDIFLSALYSELGMSKSELEAWFEENAVGSMGVDPEDVLDIVDESTNYIDSVDYVSSANTINFYHGEELVDSIDTSDFVIDGMIENVSIETISGVSYLVIDFNTASGKEDIEIPLTDIFDPSNYYTKAEVDSAISAATDDMATQTWVGNQGYITGVDLSDYATLQNVDEAVSGKADTSAVTAHTADTTIHVTSNDKSTWSGKQDALTAGRGIDIDSGNTISFTLPISAGTGEYSIVEGADNTVADGYASHAEGGATSASGVASHAEGVITQANGFASHAEGHVTHANGEDSHTEGFATIANNFSEHASGQFNNSVSDSASFGSSGNTLFSVGNGNDENTRHNAFEIRQNGDIYITSGGSDIKLQDNIGVGITSGEVETMISAATSGKSDTSEVTQAQYDAMVSGGTVDPDTFYIITDATPVDLSGYAQSSAVTEEIAAAVSGKVDSSSIVTAVTSASTDSEIPTAKAVFDAIPTGSSITTTSAVTSGSTAVITSGGVYAQLDGLKLQKVTQAEYDALVSGGTVDNNTLYVIS